MLLVWYKREFEWADVLRLWESLWTDWLSSNFHLFIALAILEKHRDVIMKHLKHFDEVLKYGTCPRFPRLLSKKAALKLTFKILTVNDLSNTIDLPSTLLRAQALFRRFQRTVDAIDKKHNFPLPSVRQRKSAVTASASGSEPPAREVSAASATGTEAAVVNGSSSSGKAAGKSRARDETLEGEKEKVISPELRGLLSREVVVLEKQAIVESGGGVG